MAGKIYIVGEVSEWSYEASLQHIRNELSRHANETEIEIYIHSPGGDVYEGVAIYNELKNSGKKIKTYGQGRVGSLATLIFLAADKGNRYMMPLTEFFIHNPWAFTVGDADELEKQSKDLKQIEDSIAKLYFNETGGVLTIDEIKQLMKEQSFISANDAVKYGFASELINSQMLVESSIMMNANKISKSQLDTKMKNLKTTVAKMLGIKNALAITTNEDGSYELDGTIEVGEAVTVDGEPAPDGEHTFDGVTFRTEGGIITEIVEGEEEETSETLTAEDVQAMIDKSIGAISAQLTEMSEAMLLVGESVKNLRDAAPKHKPVQKDNRFSAPKADEDKLNPSKLAEIRAKAKANKK